MTHPYASEAYARAFGGDYTPILLANAGIWMLSRPIASSERRDVIGCYPRCPLPANVDIAADFAALAAQGIVSLVLVTDVFFHPPEASLASQFDQVRPYKLHYVHSFSGPLPGREQPNPDEPALDPPKDDRSAMASLPLDERSVASPSPCPAAMSLINYNRHHKYEVRRALRFCETKVINLAEYLDEWYALYQALIERHRITGVQMFSRDYFAAIAKLPEFTTIGAFAKKQLVSAHIWLEHSGFAYSHLAASSKEGYAIRAAYPIYDAALRYYANRVQAVDFGAGAGTNEPSSGLSFFKKGFSNAERPCFLAGKILDPETYAKLCAAKRAREDFFPAYR